jgi:AAA domain
MLYYVCALPNKRGTGAVQEFFSDDLAKIEEWARQHDKPGWGVYDCINPLKDGASARNKESVAAVVSLRIDIDSKDIVETLPEVDAHLANMLLPPSAVIDSGRGRHADWVLKEPIPTDDAAMIARVDAVRARLVEILSGDRAPTHHAALFRRPGTHNTKEGAWLECEVLRNGGAAVDVTELEEMVALYDRPLLAPKPKANGDATVSYLDFTTKTAVDVEARLAAMRYQGPGDTGINVTWWTCMGSLLRHGTSVADAIDRLHAAAEANCQDDPNRNDWCNVLAGMAERWLRHEPEFVSLLDSRQYKVWREAEAAGKRPRLYWRQDHGLQARGMGQAAPQTLSAAAVDGTTGATVTPLPQPAAPKIRFKLTSFRDMRPGPEQLYLVDELIPAAGLVDIWGKAKCFKSFWTLDLMFHVAMGWEYRDRSVRQGEVVYCAFEGGHGYKKRIQAIRQHYELDDDGSVPLHIMSGQANLIADCRQLIADIAFQLGDTKPAAVVLDTLNKSLHGSESRDVDMSAYVRAAEAIRDTFGCVVIIVHHCGLDETRPRGHTSLPGAVDAQLHVERDGNAIRVTVEMMRDGPEDTVVTSVVESVDVGEDCAGKVLTSLVVKPADENAVSATKNMWKGRLALFRKALSEALLNSTETRMVGGEAVRVAEIEAVRAEFYRVYVAKGDTPAKKSHARLVAFHWCVDGAQQRHLIGVQVVGDKTWLWLAAPGAMHE